MDYNQRVLKSCLSNWLNDDRPSLRKVCRCEACHTALFEGDDAFKTDNEDFFCSDCITDSLVIDEKGCCCLDDDDFIDVDACPCCETSFSDVDAAYIVSSKSGEKIILCSECLHRVDVSFPGED